jgi:hypothetical protein
VRPVDTERGTIPKLSAAGRSVQNSRKKQFEQAEDLIR